MQSDLIQAALKDILAEKQDHVPGSIAHQRMERAEAALRSLRPSLSPAMCTLIESGQVEDGDADLVEPQGQALPDAADQLAQVYAAFGIGEQARTLPILLTNIENARRRAECLWAIEREFFTKEVPVEDWLADEPGETHEECPLLWGANRADYVEQFRAALADHVASQLAPAEPVPELEVWYGSMPESNGKSNFTATLRRKGASLFDTNSYTFARSEYPERVRYKADCMRFLIGEIDKEPFILDYDADKHSGYVEPPSPAVVQPVADERVRAYGIYRTNPEENEGKEFFYYAMWHNDTIPGDGERVVPGYFTPDRAVPQPAEGTRPADCSGDPQCCPENEGHGCQCSALAEKDKP